MPLGDDSDPSHGFMGRSGIGFSYQTMNLAVGRTWIEVGRDAEGRKVSWKEVWCETDETLD